MTESSHDKLKSVTTGTIGAASGLLCATVSDSSTTLGKIAKPVGWISAAVGAILLLTTFFSKNKDAAALNDKSEAITR